MAFSISESSSTLISIYDVFEFIQVNLFYRGPPAFSCLSWQRCRANRRWFVGGWAAVLVSRKAARLPAMTGKVLLLLLRRLRPLRRRDSERPNSYRGIRLLRRESSSKPRARMSDCTSPHHARLELTITSVATTSHSADAADRTFQTPALL